MHPLQEPAYKKRNKIYLVIDTDFSMRKRREAYKEATKQSELWLTALAEETGGLAFAPTAVEEMTKRAEEIASEIDSQYVVNYIPKRPRAEEDIEEYRRINVAPGVMGLHLKARRGYVANAH
jgi:hypothetical protein